MRRLRQSRLHTASLLTLVILMASWIATLEPASTQAEAATCEALLRAPDPPAPVDDREGLRSTRGALETADRARTQELHTLQAALPTHGYRLEAQQSPNRVNVTQELAAPARYLLNSVLLL